MGRTIAYYPNLNQLTGSILASLLLQQIVYWWESQDQQPFYKFSAPCQHRAYRPGDSWQEELGFTRTEFETARRRLGRKIQQGDEKSALRLGSLVLYWTDRQRLTWYELNTPLLGAKLQELSITGFSHSISNAEKPQYKEMEDNRSSFLTKKTQRITTEKSATHNSTPISSENELAVVATHPAIQAWRETMARYPRKQSWPLIAKRLGDKPNQELLTSVMTEWIAAGYRPDNVTGILDWYESRKLSEREKLY
jgi:hypothetical protein